ncbi:MAG: hypothetical protein PHC62_05705 [Candidatus Izemoplasmatales bacterium]|nr:hypothetical protein [Candidatus Izemoplasmatales bacterium]
MRAKEIPILFKLNRVYRRDLVAKNLLVLSFALVSFFFLIYMPYISYQQEITLAEKTNNNLSNQLYLIETEISTDSTPSIMEKNYKDAYDYLLTQDSNVHSYVQDILLIASDYVEISNYSVDSSLKKLSFSLSGATESEINEFLIATFESYGNIPGKSSSSRWMTLMPERINISSSKVEVIFYYA